MHIGILILICSSVAVHGASINGNLQLLSPNQDYDTKKNDDSAGKNMPSEENVLPNATIHSLSPIAKNATMFNRTEDGALDNASTNRASGNQKEDSSPKVVTNKGVGTIKNGGDKPEISSEHQHADESPNNHDASLAPPKAGKDKNNPIDGKAVISSAPTGGEARD